MKARRRLLVATVAALAAAAAVAARPSIRDLYPRREHVDPARRPASFRDVEFRTVDGLLLRGWLAPPRNGAFVVLAHGFSANRVQMLSQAEALVAAGFGVLLFDFRAHGESEGMLVTSGDAETRDLDAALSFLRRQPEARDAVVGAVGFSMGGMVVAQAAARAPSLAAVVLESTPASLEGAIRAVHASPSGLDASLDVLLHRLAGVHVGAVRPVERVCAISPRPVLLVYGAEDRDSGGDSVAQMAAAACPPKALWVIPGAGHVPSDPGAIAELDRRVVDFFAAALLRAR